MKALTLTQPWATLVAIGAKQIETRSWGTSYRGAVAIHAAKGMPHEAMETCLADPFAKKMRKNGVRVVADLPRGAVVAVAQLTEVFRFGDRTAEQISTRSAAGRLPAHEADFGDYTAGRYGFVLGSVVRLVEPIPCRGMLSLWEVPADVEAAISAQLSRAEVTRG